MDPIEKVKPHNHHVLLVALSAQGHLNPMLRLGKLLASKGLHVTLATNEIARNKFIFNSTLNTSKSNSLEDIRIEFFSDGISPEEDKEENFDSNMKLLVKFGPPSLSELIDNYSLKNGSKFSCIINNMFVPWVADVASEHDIPCAMLWIQPASLYSIYYHFYNTLNPFPTLSDPNRIVSLPGLPLLELQDLPSFVLPSNPFGMFPKMFSEMFQNMKKLKWVLVNSFYELEKDVVESMKELSPLLPIGPFVSNLSEEQSNQSNGMEINMWKPEETCIEWLDNRPVSSVVYISFGSFLVLSKEEMKNLATGLKNSKRSFLWVIKPSETTSDSNGEREFPPGFLEETKEQGLVVPWCNQTKVLMHPSISCFLTHCGWNSTLESIVAGVPIIGYPKWTDQPTNSKLVTDVFKNGLRLRTTTDANDGDKVVVSAEEIERCIEEVMNGEKGEEFKKKANEWKEEAKKAAALGGSSDQNIQHFINEIIGI